VVAAGNCGERLAGAYPMINDAGRNLGKFRDMLKFGKQGLFLARWYFQLIGILGKQFVS